MKRILEGFGVVGGVVLVETDMPFMYSDFPLPFNVPQLVSSTASPKG